MFRTSLSGLTALRIARAVLPTLALFASLATAPCGAATQPPAERPAQWEFLTSSGGVVPAGAQRRAIDDGALSTIQLSRILRPSLAITTTAGWARSRDLAAASRPGLDVWSGDLGAELRGTLWGAARALTLRPFVTIGAGARRYDSRGAGADAGTRFAGYAGAGGELGVRHVRVRLEARDYLTGRRALVGGDASSPRHELALTAGVRWAAR